MKVNHTINTPKFDRQNLYTNKKEVNFTSIGTAATSALWFFESSPALGAIGIDLASMVIPRTLVDMTRNPVAGLETARRESTSTVNHAAIGMFGMGAGLALANTMGLNKDYGIKAQKIFASNPTVDILAESFDNKYIKSTSSEKIGEYIDDVFSKVKTFSNHEGKGFDWVNLPDETKIELKKFFTEKLTDKNASKLMTKDDLAYLKTIVTSATGSETNYKLFSGNKESKVSLSVLLENVHNVSKAFMEDGVEKVFESAKSIDQNAFLKAIKKFNISRTLAGVGIASAIGVSVQPFNMYLSKKKTGSDGFVGVEGREKDKTAGFKGLKALAAGAFGFGALKSIGPFKDLMSNIQFKGMMPTIPQFKLIYGMTIMSRFLSARDKDELRESCVKDTLGFLNWLVLGNFVSKAVAIGMDKDKTLVKYIDAPESKNWMEKAGHYCKKLVKSDLATREEVLKSGLSKLGISPIKDGKALKFKELVKLIPANEAGKLMKGKLRAISIAQMSGYLYSGIVLGVLLPKLNIFMTNSSEKKRKAKLEELKKNMPPELQDAFKMMLNSSNMEFLRNNM